ncbi:hypothetical protein WJX84_005724 [Apatococcus fuscideae]|uniref:Dephospho-CoA kinase n=1 Tax=Apatococcus fuscideae TaxID=2026836 RepID=A0AAW1SVA6_9CHLO
MFLLGLTGSIGMGKTTVAAMFMRQDVPVLSADEVVHELYAPNGAAVKPLGEAFPGCIVNAAVSRPHLSQQIIADKAALLRLEAIVHPLVAEKRQAFLEANRKANKALVVLDIPLLYETGAEKEVDAVVLVSTSAEEQRQRVLDRPGMTAEKLDAILQRQMPDTEKQKQAQHLINTGCSLEATQQQVDKLIADLSCSHGPTLGLR